jgi:GNAT superfamily N-acetyltransferase
MAFTIRSATSADTVEAVATLRRSITELCVADHGNDPEAVSGWLLNKTPEHFQAWLDNTESVIAVAVDAANHVLCVGGANRSGEVMLNYVHPDARFAGVSSAMLVWLEEWLRDAGFTEARLSSSETAHRFYQARGWIGDGPPQPWRGTMVSQPMRKVF